MLQKVVAVSMVGRTLVLFFNLIPWAREGKKRKHHHESLFQLGYSLSPCLMKDPDRKSVTQINPTLIPQIQEEAGVV